MHSGSIYQAVIVGFATVFIAGAIYIVSKIGKGINKVKEIKYQLDNEIGKVDYVVEKISYIDINPKVGKVEFIEFYLDPNYESAFYSISPEKFMYLRPHLENLINKFEQTESSYGHKYAERSFFIGDKLIFSWKNEAKI